MLYMQPKMKKVMEPVGPSRGLDTADRAKIGPYHPTNIGIGPSLPLVIANASN